jgi:hypothetical protein
MLIDELLEVILIIDHEPIRVAVSVFMIVAHLRWKQSSSYPWDLCGGETHNANIRLKTPIVHEIMKVAPL